MIRGASILALLSLAAALGCAASSYRSADYDEDRMVAPAFPMEPGSGGAMPATASLAVTTEEGYSAKTSVGYDKAEQPQRPRDAVREKEAPAEPAMVVYLGYLKLRVKRLLEAVDAITALTQAAGGYVESLSARVMVVRIPASDFEKVMDSLAAKGEVLDRRVKALDVSAQFTDLGARLQVAREARDRLLRLLQEVEDVEERLRILQEVKRLTEYIESIESTLATLQNLMDYFTITIELVPVVEDTAAVVHRSPFPWVRGLQAHQATLEEGRDRIAMTVPKGFVLFAKDDAFRAQAADTTTLRAGVVENEPRGDNRFWADAIRHELDGRDEERLEEADAGGLTYQVFRNRDVAPRYYLVAVHARGDRVFVVEAFYPTEDSFRTHHAAVVEALGTFRGK